MGRLIRIDETNWQEFAAADDFEEGNYRGYVPRDYDEFPEGCFAPMSNLPLVPEDEWKDRIEYMNAHKLFPKHHRDAGGFPVLGQGRTNYCWINAVIAMMHHLRQMAGLPYVALSPASVGAKIKNFRNVGGWGSQGLEYCQKVGAVPQALWPANAIDRKYDTPETMSIREQYRVDEAFEELPARSFEHMVSALLHGFPVAIGLDWWRHEVLAVGLDVTPNGDIETDFDNSWTPDWGIDGRGKLSRKKATPDDAVVGRVVTPAEAA